MGPALEPLRGKYEIVAKLKEGGMGTIYKVRHRLLEEVRVVKVLRSQLESDPDLNRRFAQEAKAAIRLRHPNVVQIFDFLLEEGVGYIVMEYIDGVDFGELIERRRLPSLPVVVDAACQSLKALGYLHKQGFVHRDISPDNLMLGLDFESKPQVKMIDLGISRQLDSDQRLTASGMFLGKFRYSSPEHFGARGPDGVDQRSDLYSFGIVLYMLLTGRYPIRGAENSQLIAGHLFHPPLEFEESDVDGRVPTSLRQIVLRALDKDPSKRYPTAKAFSADLKKLQSQFPMTEAAFDEVRELVAERQETAFTESEAPESTKPIATQPPPTVASPAEDARDEAFDRSLETGCKLASDQHYADAIPLFEEALSIRPESTAVRELLAEAREKLEEQHKTSETLLDSEVRQLRELLGAGDLQQVRDRILSARRAYGDVEILLSVQQQVEKVEADRLRSNLVQEIDEAVHLREAGELTQAIRTLEKVRERARDDPDSTGVREQLDHEEEELEKAHRRAAELDEALYRIEKLIGNGKLVEADRELYQALETFGHEKALTKLRSNLEKIHHQERNLQVRALLEEAAKLAEAGEVSKALKSLAKARITAPARSELQGEIDAAEERCRAQLKDLELARALHGLETKVRKTLEEAGAASAQAELQGLASRFEGPTGQIVFDGLRQAVADAYQDRVNHLIRDAGTAIEAKRFGEAVVHLEEALAIDPTDEWIQDRLSQAREALEAAS